MPNITLPVLPPRPYQEGLFEAVDRGIRRVFLVWHRRAGKDHMSYQVLVREAMREVGVYYYIFPSYTQGKKILWDDEQKRKLVPKELVKKRNDQEMKMELVNGSVIQVVGSDNFDSLRGTNPKGVVMSEYGYQHPMAWEVLRPILAENKGWVIFNTTPNGHNHARSLFEYAEGSDKWYVSVLTVNDTGVLDAETLEEERRGMLPEMFLQEYFCSWEAGKVGAYYSEQMRWLRENGRITQVDWNPAQLVDTCWDIGIGDATAVWFVQRLGNEVRLIDHLEVSGKGFDEVLKELEMKPYKYRKHFMPHDFQNREYMIGESRYEYARKRGFECEIVPKLSIEEGIDAARRLMKNCFFDAIRCKMGIDALENYHKEYDLEKKVFKKMPAHDWSSHSADSFRYLAVSLKIVAMGDAFSGRSTLEVNQWGMTKEEWEEFKENHEVGRSQEIQSPFCSF